MGTGRTIDVDALIDQGGFGRYQLGVVALCGALMFLDGLDMNMVAFLGPTLAKEWGLGPQALSFIFTAGVVSSAAASLLNGPIADRRGRRSLTLAYTALFGVATLAGAFAQGPETFAIARFVAGFGLGGVLPNALALGVEYAPSRHRGFTAVVLFGLLGVGQAAGGLLTNALLVDHGWRFLIVLGGVLPLALLLVLARWLPESVRFLALREDNRQAVSGLMQKIRPAWRDDGVSRFTTASPTGKSPVRLLFADKRAGMTVLLLAISGINNAEIGFLMYWLPTVITSTGASIGQAVLATMVFVFTGIIASLVFGRFVDRIGHFPVLLAANVLAVGSLGVFGSTLGVAPAMMVAAALMGVGVLGFQAGVNSLAASFYPTSIRSTGCGWVIAAGRLLGIAGPLLGGALMATKLPVTAIFPLNAAMVAASGILLLASWRLRPAPANRSGVSDNP